MKRKVRLPPWLKSSARVDLAQLGAKIRPVVRTELAVSTNHAIVRAWARRHGWFAVVDADGFLVISPSPARVRRVMTLDRSPGDHLRVVGAALGYPSCCCRAASRAGEARLDAWADKVAGRRRIGAFGVLNPSGYRDGLALLSHIPCSSACRPSLHLAIALARHLRRFDRYSPSLRVDGLKGWRR
jgi:hypothetical protein